MSEVTGDIPFLGIFEFLQVAGFNHRDLTLQLDGAAGEGHLVLRDGNIIDAAQPQGQRGVSALFPLLQGSILGRFHILPPPPAMPEQTISLRTEQILMRIAMAMPDPGQQPTCNAEWRIQGSTALLSIEELLQIFENNKRPAACMFINKDGAQIEALLTEGGVAHAKSSKGGGAEAIYELLKHDDWNFEIRSPDAPPKVTKLIDIAGVIMEGLRRRDEQSMLSRELTTEHNPHAQEMLDRLEGGELDESDRLQLARRYMPGGEIAPAFLVAKLTVDESPAVRTAAMESLHDLPIPIIETFANDPDSPPPLLTYLLMEFGGKEISATAVANPATPLKALVHHAPQAKMPALEAYRRREETLKQERELRSALRRNPSCDFIALLDEMDKEAAPKMRKRSFVEPTGEIGADGTLVLTKPPEDSKKEKPQTRLGPRDIQYLAKRGTLRQKMNLVCSNDDDVAAEIVSQPGIPESFILGVAEMKSSNSAALRVIAGNRVYRRNTNIVHALLFNPKTPVPSSSGLLTLVRADAVAKIASSRDLPDGLRQSARQLMEKRSKRKQR